MVQLLCFAKFQAVDVFVLQTPTSNGDVNVLNSWLVNHTTTGGGNNALSALGTTWAAVAC